ncbi:MAG: CopG family transcriptional regulator [Micrococcales bacterium]|nr:CopG family transcriptional regulator [Micrococcales bacterium]
MSEAVARYEKVSWTVEAGVLAQVRARVPRGQQSAYATRALRRQLERDGLTEMIGELVEIDGPVDEDTVRTYLEQWQ